ncbi:MAG: SagB/ThcOx family dehydrogenase [Chloroflexota bacterium]|nr:SagB/ThcOx family dehydrogenase [Chloroflexota bacterium]
MNTEGIGETFQQETKYSRGKMPKGGLDWIGKPELYKEYWDHPKVNLSPPGVIQHMSIDDALRRRRSIREFSSKPLSKRQLSYLLWASTGIQRIENDYEFRTAPSAGALYPIETYLVVNNVESLSQGLYHYAIRSHHLEELAQGDLGNKVANAALGQQMCLDAAVVFIWTAIFQRSRWKYRDRAYRYVYLDAGHIAENLALAVTGLGLGCCHIAALFDDELNNLLGLGGIDESVLYMTVIGSID